MSRCSFKDKLGALVIYLILILILILNRVHLGYRVIYHDPDFHILIDNSFMICSYSFALIIWSIYIICGVEYCIGFIRLVWIAQHIGRPPQRRMVFE